MSKLDTLQKDDWSDIHVAITGVGIHPKHVHNLRRDICNELNRTWVGLSSYTSSKSNEKVQTSEENLKSDYNGKNYKKAVVDIKNNIAIYTR